MKKTIKSIVALSLVLILFSCKPTYTIPTETTQTNQKVRIFPDYKNIVIPPNIAPLNFMIKEKGEDFVVQINDGSSNPLIAGAGNDGVVQFDLDTWHEFIQKNKSNNLAVTIYIKKDGHWIEYPNFHIKVAKEDIDEYLSYRLIEPGYIIYRQLGLYQRNLTNYDVKTIYENSRTLDMDKTHCVNCHNYQNYSTKNMLFHIRGPHGGTFLSIDGKKEMLNPKHDSIMGNAVYPAWHPKHKWIAFSSNSTGQVFYLVDKQKVEVIDKGSDIIFYNAETNEVSNILKKKNDFETFPAWAPSGDRLFYCVAEAKFTEGLPDSLFDATTIQNFKNIKYKLMSMTFDEKSLTFGEPQLEYNAEAEGKSVSFPKVSPDGRYVLFATGSFGQFHIWHKDSDLYVKDLQTGKIYPLSAANSKNVDSYHSWSSNGRWIVFSSRRDDGSFTRSYITYFDENGQAHKAFMLPQEDPTYNIRLFKSFNVPELTKDAVSLSFKEIKETIFGKTPKNVKYKNLDI